MSKLKNTNNHNCKYLTVQQFQLYPKLSSDSTKKLLYVMRSYLLIIAVLFVSVQRSSAQLDGAPPPLPDTGKYY